jgi:hypothetical protein
MLGSLVSVQDNDYIQVIPVYLTYSGCFDTHTEGSCTETREPSMNPLYEYQNNQSKSNIQV